MYDNFNRVPVEQAEAGDICALTGLPDVAIGETICAREAPNPLPTIKARISAKLVQLHTIIARPEWLSV